MRLIGIAVAAVVFLAAFLSPYAVCCADTVQKAELSAVSGVITAVDWVGDKIVVRTFHAGQADEISFIVPDVAVIVKGTSKISLGNINIADKVTVQYYGDFGGLKAVRITVK
ncbi:MAG: hypothetical protein WC329_03245 [Candidatus Omnitrophota bacterium]|jgi:hypothetical protein|nr:hypothetical protein [Candidatus Omnitrophota bacterium]